ncbi:MAG: CP family cyanate transporter-like MFS transporter [Halioglobus sp.]|jgi:CP family cyanate transporter-like MFS transporter
MVADTGLSRASVGLITTLPVLLMGVMASFSPRLAARWGLERCISFALALLTLSLALRMWADRPALLMISAAGIGIGIAIAGTLMAGFIKQHFSNRLHSVVPLYTFSMILGAALGLVLTLPLLELLGDWRWTMAAWSLPALLAWAVWQPVVPPTSNSARTSAPTLPLGSAKAWVLTLLFALQTAIFYSLTTWLVARYEEAGVTLVQASGFASVFMFAGLGGAFLAPLLMRWVRRTAHLLIAISLTACAALISIVLWPLQWPLVACSIAGMALTSMFALSLTLPIHEAETPLEAASLTSMMLTFGFGLGSFAPSLAGIARDVSGSYVLPFTVLAAASAIMVLLSALLGYLDRKKA